MPNSSSYTVGWICAITTEYVAAQAFLDETHERPKYLSSLDDNDYTWGRIGNHNVVIATSSGRDWGLAPTAIVATHLLRSFNSISILLLVGIGGGVPQELNDIRLGDVVVGSSARGEVAVFQYDRGRHENGGQFVPMGRLKEPPPILQTTVNRLRDRHMREGHRLEKAIDDVFSKNRRLLQRYRPPPAEMDYLFEASYQHVGERRDCGHGCDLSRLVPRYHRDIDNSLVVHHGLVASGNTVIRDAHMRDQLSREKGILCFETEAAGVMSYYPCLVIRGISDYSDSHAHSLWHGYAAMTAAAYAKELVHTIPSNNTEVDQRKEREKIEIAIICALPREADAVKAVFDFCCDNSLEKYGKASGDPNAYTVGAIGSHDVVLAHLPDMGEVNSASVAAYCKSSFENIRLALVVGICGGVPSPQNNEEVMLGDVIISNGIIQYDFGKQYPDGFKTRDGPLDTLPRPNMEIQSLLAMLKTRDYRRALEQKTTAYIPTLCQQLSEPTNYPGSSEDKLYKSDYRHKHFNPFLCSTCANCKHATDRVCDEALHASCDELKCSASRLVKRHRSNKGNSPTIHFGMIASGNTVMKSGLVRDEIANRWGAIAFEMEGAGVWDHFPCLVIKGVCDYADCHKEKKWQEYASSTAAACTRSFLEYWAPRNARDG